MTVQYNVPVKVLNLPGKKDVADTHYCVFQDRHGKQEWVFYSERDFPYIGKMMVVHAFDRDVAQQAHNRLKSLERNTGDILVLPITESDFEEDQMRDAESSLAEILGPCWSCP